MSLKVIHLVFISMSILLAAGCGFLAFQNYRTQPATTDLVVVIASVVAIALLVGYEVWFLRKTRRIIL